MTAASTRGDEQAAGAALGRDAALRREGAVWALCVLAGALVLAGRVAAPDPSPGDEGFACPHPREAAAERGWTRAVSCAPPPGGGHALRGPARWLFGGRIDLNAADARLLEALPGVGPTRARDIVAERRRRPFEAVADLVRVHGIGPKTVARLRPFVRVDRAGARAAGVSGESGPTANTGGEG